MAKKDCTELQKVLAEYATNIAARGEASDFDGVIAVMSKDGAVDRRQVSDAIHEYYSRSASDGQKKALSTLATMKQEAKTESRLHKRIESLERQVKTGEWEKTKAGRRRYNETVKQLREEANRLSKQVQRAKKNSQEGIDSRKAPVQKRIDELLGQIEETRQGNIPVKRVPERLKTDPELDRLRARRNALKSELDLRIESLKPKNALSVIGEANKASRVIMTLGDLSGVLRQGGFSTITNPKIALTKGLPNMFRALKSPEGMARMERELEAHPHRDLAEIAKLDIGSRLQAAPEELFDSYLVRKVPGLKQAADISERAYTAYLETMRMHQFGTLVEAAGGAEKVGEEGARQIAKAVNVFTGRGDSDNKIVQSIMNLNGIMFAPKWMVSRFQFVADIPSDIAFGSKEMRHVRKVLAKEYAKYAAGLATIAGAVMAAGGETEPDPRSSDFGKVKFGNTRFDLASGLAQPIVLMSRLVSGETKSSVSGKITPIRGDVPYGSATASDVVWRFIRGKAAPGVSAAIDLAEGKNVVGDEATVGAVVLSRYFPLSLQSWWEQMEEYGVPKGTAMSMVEALGVSLQTYESRAKDVGEDQAYKELFDIDLDLDLDLDLGLD